MKITVVTICYNAENYIEKTLTSVLSQTYTDIEYLIQDGGSKDATMHIVNEVSSRLDKRSAMKVVSEPDKGLYNAMNKAIDRATGEYIIFMNSGDIFYEDDVVERIVSFIDKQESAPEIVFGDVLRRKTTGDVPEKYKGSKPLLKLLLTGNIPSHQSTFTKVSVMRELGFDEEYKITADYDFYARAYSLKKNISYAQGITVSIVDNLTGISSEGGNLNKMREEDDRSLKKNLPMWYALINTPKKFYRFVKDNAYR